jgi:hypothetical protein
LDIQQLHQAIAVLNDEPTNSLWVTSRKIR